MREDEVLRRIEAHLRVVCRIDAGDPFFDQRTQLFEAGYLDSVAVEELLEFIAEEFGVEIPEADLMSDEFSDMRGMATVVSRLSTPTRPT